MILKKLSVHAILFTLPLDQSVLNLVYSQPLCLREHEGCVDSRQHADPSEDVEQGSQADGFEERIEDEEDNRIAEPRPFYHQH